jgi:hypothetical protein
MTIDLCDQTSRTSSASNANDISRLITRITNDKVVKTDAIEEV